MSGSDHQKTLDHEALRLGAALAASKIGVFEFEPQNDRAFWDSRVGELWGIPPDEVITYETVIERVHPEDVALHDEATVQALDPQGSGEMDMEYRVLPRDGGPMRWIRAVAVCTFEGDVPVKLLGTVQDVTDRRQFEERNLLLLNELQHRVKNTLASIISVIKLTRASNKTVDDYANSLEDRLLSMAETHTLLGRSDWQNVAIRKILEIEFNAFVGDQPDVYTITGDDLYIPARQVKVVAMGIHELLTNSLKHGALRSKDGHILIDIVHDNGRARFVWKETGPPLEPNADPPRQGFGSLLLGAIMSAELNGTSSYEIQQQGAVFQLDFPVSKEKYDD